MFSVVIITLNEADQIASCLEPLRRVTDDIVIVDALSQDETAKICRNMGGRVFEKAWVNYSENKNFGNQQAKYDWILSIDADEVLSEELIQTLLHLKLENGKVYALDRISSFCGKWIRHGAWYPDWKPRLFNKKEISWTGDFVHEKLNIPEGHVVIRLPGKLWHNSCKSEGAYKKRLKKYAQLAGKELFKKDKKANISRQLGGTIFRFVRDYFLRKGFLDGKEGFKIARLNAWVVFEKYRILRELRRNNQNRTTKK